MISSRYVFTQVSGYTFPMALAAMTAHTWQVGTYLILDMDDLGDDDVAST